MTGETLHVKTPVRESMTMSKVAGTSVYLKMDSAQPSGSFKIRGIGHLCKTVQDGVTGLCRGWGQSSSLGLAAQGNSAQGCPASELSYGPDPFPLSRLGVLAVGAQHSAHATCMQGCPQGPQGGLVPDPSPPDSAVG